MKWRIARQTLGWESPPFVVPDDIRAAWDHREAGAAAEKKWNRIWKRYKREFPADGAEFERRMKGDLPANWPDIVQEALAAAAAVHARAGDARLLAARAQRARPEDAGDAGRLGGSHRLGQHAPQGFGGSHAATTSRPTTSTTACASSA